MRLLQSSVFKALALVLLISFTNGELQSQDFKGEKIFGGFNAKSNYIKGMAVLMSQADESSRPESSCSGSILRGRWILTAAHCILNNDDSNPPYKWYIIPSIKRPTHKNFKKYGIAVKHIYYHKKFTFATMEDSQYDIALLELEDQIPKNRMEKVRIGKRPKSNEAVMAVGYGTKDWGGDMAKIVQQTKMIVQDTSTCRDNVPDGDLFASKMVCTASEDWDDGNKQTNGICGGDSGGPIFRITKNKKLVQYGVLALTTGNPSCQQPFTIAYYVKVKDFRKSISKVMKGDYKKDWYKVSGDLLE